MKRPRADFNARVLASLFLFAIGGWFAIARQASFTLGGRRDATSASRRGSPVSLEGLDAVALGTALIGLGIMNIAFGMKSERRKPVFWLGAVLFLLPLSYGVGLLVLDVYEFITRVMAS